ATPKSEIASTTSTTNDTTHNPNNTATKSPLSPRADRPTPTRPKLSPTDPVEAAPVIGPKLASRLATIGILTVADLLAADAGSLSIKLADSRLDRAAVATWQAVARLVIDIPGINGTEAQLLHGAGYGTLSAVRDTSADTISQAVTRYAATDAGRALLRGSDPPTPQSVTRWVAVVAAEPGSKAA
ncbi:MAG: DUF4332 domain-containing protein, partial [Hyphomicrobiaceae bacterium]|nr:DUF4332 domain-containing protein [Hyphomicrobiaceae bacterium]